ncbi:hypothetical protein ACHZ97_04295 [Lysobacter soli]|uniref:hypothetical protein n=1 Tax=Lysobacter soli TaxID=453783 RepID=UPI0037C9B8D4
MSYQPWENSVRTQMDAGAAKVRRRFTAVGDDVALAVPLRLDQVDVLEAFVVGTLKDVLPFDWKDFRRPNTVGNAATYRFRKRPTYAPWGDDFVLATLDLERLP